MQQQQQQQKAIITTNSRKETTIKTTNKQNQIKTAPTRQNEARKTEQKQILKS